MAHVEHTALRALCPPRDAVSSTLAHLDPWLIPPALPGAADSAVDNKTHPARPQGPVEGASDAV